MVHQPLGENPVLNYFEQVLGVRSVLLPERSLEDVPAPQGRRILPIVFLVGHELAPAESEIFHKIIAAMKLTLDWQLVSLSKAQKQLLAEPVQIRELVAFGLGELAIAPFLGSAGVYTSIASIEDMIQDPKLKREAWTQLQAVMARIQAVV